jgi:hypothetical protein
MSVLGHSRPNGRASIVGRCQLLSESNPLSASTSLADAIAIFAVAAYGVFFLAAYALPETRGRVLRADA